MTRWRSVPPRYGTSHLSLSTLVGSILHYISFPNDRTRERACQGYIHYVSFQKCPSSLEPFLSRVTRSTFLLTRFQDDIRSLGRVSKTRRVSDGEFQKVPEGREFGSLRLSSFMGPCIALSIIWLQCRGETCHVQDPPLSRCFKSGRNGKNGRIKLTLIALPVADLVCTY